MDAQRVRDAAGGRAVRRPSAYGMVEQHLRHFSEDQPDVVEGADADEDARIGAVQVIGGDVRVLESLPRRFEQEPLLRIDVGCFAR